MKAEKSVMRLQLFIVMVFLALLPSTVMAATTVLGAYYRADQSFSQFKRFWHEGWNLPDDQKHDDSLDRDDENIIGGSIHVLIRNDNSSTLEISDVFLEGISLKKSIVFSDQRKKRKPASIYFGNLPKNRLEQLILLGEPIWWKIDPDKIEANGVGEVVVRLRQKPKSAKIRIGLVCRSDTVEVSVPIQDAYPRVAGVSFSSSLDSVYLYFRHPDGGEHAPLKIIMDGRDVTNRSTIRRDERLDTVAVILKLDEKLQTGSFHCFQGMYDDRKMASAGIRTWSDDFAYGIWGGQPGKAGDS
jgi:hypothetical protein